MIELPDLRQYPRVYLDTETTGLKYEDYAVGLSYKTPDGKKDYVAWGHEGGGNNADLSTVIRWFNDQFGPGGPAAVFHNAPFDLRKLGVLGMNVKTRVEDTGFMAPIHNELEPSFSLDALSKKYAGISKSDTELNEWCARKFGGKATRTGQAKNYWRAPATVVREYAIGDVDMTEGIYLALNPKLDEEGLRDVYELEIALIPLLHKMYEYGVRVDRDGANALKKKLLRELQILQHEWYDEFPGVSYTSTHQLAKVFDRLGLAYPLTDKGNPSITKFVLDAVDHPIGDMIRRMKFIEHMTGTFIDSYVLGACKDDGCVHPEFHPLKTDSYGTVSGRFSSGGESKNLQNLPARDEEVAPMVRGMYIPWSKDHDWAKCDYSQIEYRFFAHYAGGKMREAYIQNPLADFHQMVADMAGIPRKPAKNVNFAKLYGAGLKKLAQTIGCSVDEAAELVAQYDAKIPEAQGLYAKADRRAASRGYIITWGGRKRRFEQQGRRFIQTHKALNALLQGSAADLIKRTMVRVADIVDWQNVFLHLTVHDELDFSVPKGEQGQKFLKQVKELAEDYPDITVPIVMDVEVGPDWGHVEELDLAA